MTPWLHCGNESEHAEHHWDSPRFGGVTCGGTEAPEPSINFDNADGAMHRYECLYVIAGHEDHVGVIHAVTEDGYTTVDDIPMMLANVMQFCVEEIKLVAAVEVGM